MAPRCVTTLLRLSSPTFNVINLRGSRQPSANTTYSWEVSAHGIQSCFLGDGGIERCGEERCADEKEVSGYGVEEEQLCICGAAFFRHWFESFCWRVFCTSSLFVCMFFTFSIDFFHIQIPRSLNSMIPSFTAHILSPALTIII